MCVHYNITRLSVLEVDCPQFLGVPLEFLGGPDACGPCTEHSLMLRIYRFAGGLLGLIAVWIAALRSDLQPDQYLAVLLAPVFLLALFGLYSVTSLVYGVITFRTVPEEATALRQDIADARKDLQAHNIS
ncbi:hypothetical protein ABBQ32_001421 [Trebouxia sp. C0010 RCD-2024]